MVDVYVLNYSENPYQKGRVRKAVEGLGAKILNQFSRRPKYGLKKRELPELLIEGNDLDLMKNSDEIWIISGFFSKRYFKLLFDGEKMAKKSKKPIRYFSICHQGPGIGKMREIDRNYLEEKNE